MGAGGHEPSDRPLDDRGLQVLDFESRAWPSVAAKTEAIRSELGMSGARYYRLLGELIDSPAALRHDPVLVHRLLRLREARRAERAARSLSLGRLD